MSEHGMRAVRKSDFLFIRKVVDKPRLVITADTADGYKDFASSYKKIVLG